MLEVLKEAPTAAPWLAAKAPALLGAEADVTLTVRLMRKDLMSAVATGARAGLAMPLTSGALAAFSAAVAGGAGAGDLAELAKFMREGMVQNFDT
jgi:3-hydroxyisobutyrate dehydrogenase-like beta-hydroxyacid dehydrogenase